MSANDEKLREIRLLVLRLLEDEGDAQSTARLEQILSSDRDAEEYYFELLQVNLALRHVRKLGHVEAELPTRGAIDLDLWRALAHEEKVAPEVEVERPCEDSIQQIHTSALRVKPTTREVSKLAVLTAMISVAAVLLAVIWINIRPYPREFVAMLVDSVDAKWSSADGSMESGSLLYNQSGPLRLEKGIAKIEFDYGAVVVLEAPAEIELKTGESMSLNYGRLYSQVPLHATGFTVDTPSSKIVDLGTEFGVKVDVDGTSDIHMIKGKASLIPGGKGKKRKGINVAAGQAKSVDAMGTVSDVSLKNEAFVRDIESKAGFVWRGQSLDLADIVGGGNGFGSGKKNAGISVRTGVFHEKVMPPESLAKSGYDYKYKEVSTVDFIDGVFIPTDTETMQVSSHGHTFDITSKVAPGNFGAAIANYDASTGSIEPILGGLKYAKKDSLIMMRRNKGITFDLEKIRSRVPGLRITRFSSVAGVSESDLSVEKISANFYVLVDGEKKVVSKHISGGSGPAKFEVELTDENRFLTLITSYESFGMSNSSMFAEPRLILEQATE
ncbi:FecR protein [Anaerohalosphaera lusitana]|uniref:FecR protein n=1 Tax=Anaerohalosphaera lusitana TaxID=1936003 RepID=A0A1U9NMY6_9BACT|nr:FecR domain-containing protein [Anaerohalosphaera lusitana]AQT69195.1 FecR protein [Anaerohalosphaera lusitana]